ncbi:unnamed protein product [Notodromas monacha]|uniref:Uncharacterized protein n=1 Tax=Notodromas monacha TaxID=399045 RepID=A0A7R9BQF0_9CRUS|nr:unnamed protein product [Notodromas monacha]CAG0919771.1 unnamed protein product [Notodromas monacha]
MVVAAVADAEPAGGARSDLKAPSGLDEVLDQLQGSPGAMAKLFGDDEADMGDRESAAGRKRNMPRAAGTASMAGS